MKIKSTVWQVLAAGTFCVGLLYALGIAGGDAVGQPITDGEFVTALCLLLAALAMLRIGFAVQDAEEKTSKKVHKEPRNAVKGRKKVG